MPDRTETIAGEITKQFRLLLQKETLRIVAIDGRCAAGKTTLALELQRRLKCALFHMDEFFLRPEQYSEKRFREPGGNVDYERFERKILIPLRQGEKMIFYRPYDCHRQALLRPVPVTVTPIVLVEGSYSCHPTLWAYYDFHIFLTTDRETQLHRIGKRNGNMAEIFEKRWIPLEETYFQKTSLQEHCELCFET